MGHMSYLSRNIHVDRNDGEQLSRVGADEKGLRYVDHIGDSPEQESLTVNVQIHDTLD